MFEIFAAGGWLMYPILICSILVLAISLERFWALKTNKVAPPNLSSEVWAQIKQQQMDSAKLKALKSHSILGTLLAAGLNNARHGREIMKDSIEEAGRQANHELERYISILGTVASVAPLLGLLGTVIGMIEVFSAIMIQGTGNANALAGGISEALITTAAGLIVAIPAMMLHKYYQRRIEHLVIILEREAVKLMDAIHGEAQRFDEARAA